MPAAPPSNLSAERHPTSACPSGPLPGAGLPACPPGPPACPPPGPACLHSISSRLEQLLPLGSAVLTEPTSVGYYAYYYRTYVSERPPCVCVSARACVLRACTHVCTRACVCAYQCGVPSVSVSHAAAPPPIQPCRPLGWYLPTRPTHTHTSTHTHTHTHTRAPHTHTHTHTRTQAAEAPGQRAGVLEAPAGGGESPGGQRERGLHS